MTMKRPGSDGFWLEIEPSARASPPRRARRRHGGASLGGGQAGSVAGVAALRYSQAGLGGRAWWLEELKALKAGSKGAL